MLTPSVEVTRGDTKGQKGKEEEDGKKKDEFERKEESTMYLCVCILTQERDFCVCACLIH